MNGRALVLCKSMEEEWTSTHADQATDEEEIIIKSPRIFFPSSKGIVFCHLASGGIPDLPALCDGQSPSSWALLFLTQRQSLGIACL